MRYNTHYNTQPSKYDYIANNINIEMKNSKCINTFESTNVERTLSALEVQII